MTGNFISSNFSENGEELEELFEYTRLVDSFYLSCGLVPDSFKDVEGYRSMHRDISNDSIVFLNQTQNSTAAQTVFDNVAKETIVFEDKDSLDQNTTAASVAGEVISTHTSHQEQQATETHDDGFETRVAPPVSDHLTSDTGRFFGGWTREPCVNELQAKRASDLLLEFKKDFSEIKNEFTQPNGGVVKQLLVSSMTERYMIYEKGDRTFPDKESLMSRSDLNAELNELFSRQIAKLDFINLLILARTMGFEIERFTIDINEIVQFANKMLDIYEKSDHSSELSFGQWLVKYQYPNSDGMKRGIRDMCVTPRTSDARTWFIGLLQTGNFSILEDSQIVR